MSLTKRIAIAATLAVATFSVPAFAGPDKAACVAALDRAQSLESAQKLIEARASFVTCASDACPEAVREDCGRLLQSVDATIPSIVLAAQSGGHDANDAKAFLDGEPVALDGRAIAIDPGPHLARFERPGAGAIEVRVVARAGEKNRLVTGTFFAARPEPKQARVEGSRVPVIPLVIAGTGLLAIGGGVMFRMQADAEAERLRGSCAPACDPAERDALSDKLVMSNVSLAFGIGALAVSAVTWLIDSRR
jgi:hypothetical protein